MPYKGNHYKEQIIAGIIIAAILGAVYAMMYIINLIF